MTVMIMFNPQTSDEFIALKKNGAGTKSKKNLPIQKCTKEWILCMDAEFKFIG